MLSAWTPRQTPAQLRVGTQQHALINLLDGHVRSLRALQSNALPGAVQPRAEDALAAADAARPCVLQMAAAVDALDETISATRNVFGQRDHATESINKMVGRLTSRRVRLLDRAHLPRWTR